MRTTPALAAADVAEWLQQHQPYRLIFPDELHQGLKGDVEHLLNIIKSQMTDRQQKTVNDRAMSSPPFVGLHLMSSS